MEGEERVPCPSLEHLPLGPRRRPVLRHLHQHVQPLLHRREGQLDPTLVVVHLSGHDGEIGLVDPSVFERALEPALRVEVLAADHHAAGLPIESMGDVGRLVAVLLAEQIGQRVAVVGRRRMHRQPGRLVDAEHVVVLVDHAEVEGRRRLLEPRPDEDDRLPDPRALRGSAPAPIGAVAAGANDLVRASAGEARDAVLDEAVEAEPRQLPRHVEGQDDPVRIGPRRMVHAAQRGSTRPS